MNLPLIARLLGRFALFFTACAAPPAVMGLSDVRTAPIDGEAGFVSLVIAGAVVGGVLLWLGRRATRDLFRKESLVVVGTSWVLAGALGAVPFVASGAIPDPLDALFESLSGLTTTGASVLGSRAHAAIEELPNSLLLWRSELQWMGGLGIILMFVVLLPAFGVSPQSLIESESVGVSDPRERPRMVQRARSLFRIYVALTAAEIALLWGVGRLSVFDAVCHALTTLPSGGFSTKNASIGAFDSAVVEAIVIVFMLLAGTNFLVIRNAVLRDTPSGVKPLRDPEFRLYIGIAFGGILITAVGLWLWGGTVPDASAGGVKDYTDVGWCVRDAAFNVVSVMSCTGFASANFQCWPKPILLLLLFMMFVGGSTGSTSGGIKVYRLLVVWKIVVLQLRAFVRPRAVQLVKVEGQVLTGKQLSGILTLVLVWIAGAAAGTFVLAMDPRLDILSAVSANLTCLGCVGPGITAVVEHATGSFTIANVGGLDLGPYGSFGELHDWGKLVLCLQMVLGRLEFLAPLVLLTPGFWRRS